MIRIIPFNETHVKIACDDWGIEQELSDYMTFMVPGYKFMPSYKNGMFDGRIRLFDMRKKTIYKGLIEEVIKFCKNRKYELEIDITLKNANAMTLEQVSGYVDKLNLHGKGNKLDVREYQYEAIHRSISWDRQLLLSPTSSGKSAIIYSYMRWHIQSEHKLLIVVPNTMLVEQLFSDFKDYSSHNGFDVEDNISTLYSGKERVFEKPVVISTWQSLAAMLKNDTEKFQHLTERTDACVFDEAHTYKANVVLSVLEKFTKTKYRLGTTGTIDDSKINSLVLQGLMGPIYKVISTKQLMDNNQIVNLNINCISLQYPEHVCKAYKGMSYQEEIDFLVGYAPRNKFIAKLASTVKGNVLVLFNFVERHGAVLEQLVREQTERPVFFVHGGVDNDERESIRNLLDSHTDAIVIATSSLMSTGVNIPSIENIIFAIPSKSTNRVRQSIGRGLRLKKGKTECKLFDISDNLSHKAWKNITLTHLEERIEIYTKEEFNFTIQKITIK